MRLTSLTLTALFVGIAHADPILMSYYNGGNGSILAGAADTPYTHITVAFLLPNPDSPTQLGFDAIGTSMYGPTVSASIAQSIRSLQAGGTKVLLSFGGATVTSAQYATLNANIPSLAASITNFVRNPIAEDGLELHFDGIDIDWEDTAAFIDPLAAGYDGAEFLTNLTMELRTSANLPSSEGWLLTHAPQPPYLSSDPNWSSNGYGQYATVLNQVGDQIDWINMQYYNNPGFLTAESAVENYNDIVAGWSGIPGVPDFHGMPASKIVIGKLDALRAGESGYMPASEVASDIVAPLVAAYGEDFGGVFSWQFADDPDGTWASTVATAFPVVPEPSVVCLLALPALFAAASRLLRPGSGRAFPLASARTPGIIHGSS